MNALSAIYHHSCAQVADSCKKVKEGYKNLNGRYRLYLPQGDNSGITTKFGQKQAFSTSLSITLIVGTIFRLAGAAFVPSLTIGLAVGLATFAHQCYIYSDHHKFATPPKSFSLSVYYKCAESFNNAERTAYALLAKCQTAWKGRNKTKIEV